MVYASTLCIITMEQRLVQTLKVSVGIHRGVH